MRDKLVLITTMTAIAALLVGCSTDTTARAASSISDPASATSDAASSTTAAATTPEPVDYTALVLTAADFPAGFTYSALSPLQLAAASANRPAKEDAVVDPPQCQQALDLSSGSDGNETAALAAAQDPATTVSYVEILGPASYPLSDLDTMVATCGTFTAVQGDQDVNANLTITTAPSPGADDTRVLLQDLGRQGGVQRIEVPVMMADVGDVRITLAATPGANLTPVDRAQLNQLFAAAIAKVRASS